MTRGVPKRKIRVASIPLPPPGGAVPSVPSRVHAGLMVGVGVDVGVGVAVAVDVAVGVAEGVAVGVAPDCAQYLPPSFKSPPGSLSPPQTIISVPVHTAVWLRRPMGAAVV